MSKFMFITISIYCKNQTNMIFYSQCLRLTYILFFFMYFPFSHENILSILFIPSKICFYPCKSVSSLVFLAPVESPCGVPFGIIQRVSLLGLKSVFICVNLRIKIIPSILFILSKNLILPRNSRIQAVVRTKKEGRNSPLFLVRYGLRTTSPAPSSFPRWGHRFRPSRGPCSIPAAVRPACARCPCWGHPAWAP